MDKGVKVSMEKGFSLSLRFSEKPEYHVISKLVGRVPCEGQQASSTTFNIGLDISVRTKSTEK